MGNIRKEITRLAVNIDEVQPHPKNVRQGDIGAICTSLTAHGQYRPLIVQASTGFIMAGNHTWAAAKSLGWEKVAVVKIDCDDDRALRILIADNKTSDLASYDSRGLVDLLSEFARGFDMEGLIWDQDDLDDLLRQQTTSIANMAMPNILALPNEGGVNPLETAENTVLNDTKVAQFYLTAGEFEQLRQALHATGITNRNDALMAVVMQWLQTRNG